MSKTWAQVWNRLPAIKRIKLAVSAGLTGSKESPGWPKASTLLEEGKASWADLKDKEQETLISTILDLAARYQKRREHIISETSRKLGVSREYLRSSQPWIQEGRAPRDEQEFTDWARSQHPNACKRYEVAFPIKTFNGRCAHCVKKKPCTSFYSHTGMCETGYFEPDRIKKLKWSDFQKLYRRARRKVERTLL